MWTCKSTTVFAWISRGYWPSRCSTSGDRQVSPRLRWRGALESAGPRSTALRVPARTPLSERSGRFVALFGLTLATFFTLDTCDSGGSVAGLARAETGNEAVETAVWPLIGLARAARPVRQNRSTRRPENASTAYTNDARNHSRFRIPQIIGFVDGSSPLPQRLCISRSVTDLRSDGI